MIIVYVHRPLQEIKSKIDEIHEITQISISTTEIHKYLGAKT